MFYCEPCGEKNGWPVWSPRRSRGPCEICRRVASCFDVPSSALPPVRRPDEYSVASETPDE
jgi:hypothetical protein